MDTPDMSQHVAALDQLARKHGLPMKNVADQLIEHGLQHADRILDWSPRDLRDMPQVSSSESRAPIVN